MTQFNHDLTKLLPTKLTALLSDMGFTTFTPVQEQSLPPIIDGKDILAQAQTGSGKTLAFAIGLLLKINPRFFGVQALVMCPTRELADQVSKEIRKVARYQDNIKVLSLCGGMSFGPQVGSLEHGAHIVVGTPGRLMEHLRKGTLRLNALNTLVLDEADRMLDMGFVDSIREVVELTPSNRQTLLFSATYDATVEAVSAEFQNNPISIKVEAQEDLKPNIEQFFVRSENKDKCETLLATLQHFEPRQVIVFCNTKAESQIVADWLQQHRVDVLCLQETKCPDDKFPHEGFESLGYTHRAIRGEKGYNGVAILSRLPIEKSAHHDQVGTRPANGSKDGIAERFNIIEIPMFDDAGCYAGVGRER